MSIKAKLYALISSVILTFAITGAIVVLMRMPVNTIQREQEIINRFGEELYDVKNVLSEFSLSPFKGHLEVYSDAKKELREAFEAISNVTYIPSHDENAAKAIKSIGLLMDLINDRLSSIDRALERVTVSGDKVYPNSVSYSLITVFTQVSVYQGESDFAALLLATQSLISNINVATQAMNTSLGTITKQNEVINQEVQRVIRGANMMAGGVILFGILVSIVVSSLMARHIVKNIVALGQSVNEIAKGDFTIDVTVTAKGEFQELAKDMNQLQEKFRESLGKIKMVSAANVEVKSDLLSLAEETSTAAVQISANADSIRKQVGNLSREVGTTKEASQTIQERVEGLNDQIHDQIAMVEESSSAINQMISSIQNVSHQTGESRGKAEKLVEVSRSGGEKLTITMNNLGQVAEFVSDIKKMVALINGIAAQTNLLAMNAAIEAAHAGDAGRGFSVVADEIRKLAEAAGKNSKEIGASLKGITEAIDKAQESGHVTQESFSGIEGFIDDVTQSFKNIDLSMSELSSGSSEILTSMQSLNQISQDVRTGASDIQENSNRVNSVIDKTVAVTHEVSGAIQEIYGGMEEISNSVQHINSISQRMGQLSDELNREAKYFKTEEEQELPTLEEDRSELEALEPQDLEEA